MSERGGGADRLHADAVGLYARAERVGIEGAGAGAVDVGGAVVAGPEMADVVGGVAGLVGGVDLRAAVREGFPPERAGVALEVAAHALLEILDLGLDGVDADGEAAGEDGLVEIEGVALCAEIVVANLDGAAALEGCPLAGDIDGAAGIDVAEGEAAGAAAEFDALGVKDVGGEIPREAVAELADGGEAADVNLVAAAVADDGADGALVVELVLGAHPEVDGVEVIVEGEVLEELLRHDRDRVGEVLE